MSREGPATAQRSGYPTSRPTAEATCNRLCVRPSSRDHALQQQVAQTARQLAFAGRSLPRAAPRRRRGCLRSGRRSCRSATSAGESRSARRAARTTPRLERPELEQKRRARPADAVGQPSHPLRRRELVRAVGREQENRPVVEVVREEDEKIECRRVRPVHVFEHDQHRCGCSPVDEQRSTSSNTRSCVPVVPVACQGLPSGRSASTNGWYGSSVPTRSIERPRRISKPASRARVGEFGYEAALADSGLSGDEDDRTASQRIASSTRPSASSSRARPTKMSLARTSISASMAPRPRSGCAT